MPIQTLPVAVRMRRERVPGAMSRWQPWRWTLDGVQPLASPLAGLPDCVERNGNRQVWLHPGFEASLYRDDAEGYYLNLSTTAPCWFVLWRLEEEPTVDVEPIARPQVVTLSYHDAGRWLDAQESVEQVPAQAEVVAWLRAFTLVHYRPEPKRRQRPESFRGLTDRFGQPASVSTGWRREGGHDVG